MKNSPIRPARIFLLLLATLALMIPFRATACRLADAPKMTPLEVVSGVSNHFGFQLYQQMAASKADGNQFMSPFSVFAALAMTSEGANGATLELLRKSLGLPETAILHEGLAQLGQALSRADAPYALAVANAIWPEKTAKISPEFIATIQKVYHGASKPLDFQHQAEASRLAINAWVEQKTNKRIKDLIPAGAIDASTAMVLTNAIFFKGKWKLEFDKARTEVAAFTQENGTELKAPLMYQPSSEDNQLRYAELDGIQAVELPYKGDDLSMVILLPAQGKMAQFEKGLDSERWAKLQNSLRPAQVNVWLPRFKMELGGSIRSELSAMGLADLFKAGDFSRMFTSGSGFAVSDVIHKAFVEVNEEGTEAAAATAVIMRETAVMHDEPDPIYDFRADHPFIFMIQHNASKSILFMGKVMNPIDN